MPLVHGISEDMLVNEKTFAELLPEIESFIEGLPLVAHNASVEKCCIRDACAYYGIETSIDYNNIIDTLPLSREAEAKMGKVVEGQGTHSLDAVCRRFGVEVKKHHNALDDAEMCGGLMIVFYKILVDNDEPTHLQKDTINEEETSRKLIESKHDVAIENMASKRGCLGLILLAIILSLAFI